MGCGSSSSSAIQPIHGIYSSSNTRRSLETAAYKPGSRLHLSDVASESRAMPRKEPWFEHTTTASTLMGAKQSQSGDQAQGASGDDASRRSSRKTTDGSPVMPARSYSPEAKKPEIVQQNGSKAPHKAVQRAIMMSGGKTERKGEIPKQLTRGLMITPSMSMSESQSSAWTDPSPMSVAAESVQGQSERPEPKYGTPSFSSKGRIKGRSRDPTPRKDAEFERPWAETTPKSRFLLDLHTRSKSFVGMEQLLAGGAVLRLRPGTPVQRGNQPFPADGKTLPAQPSAQQAQTQTLTLPSQVNESKVTPRARLIQNTPSALGKGKRRRRVRSNSTSSIFVNCTVFVPNDKENIDAVAIIISQCINREPVACRPDLNESSVMANGTFKLEYRTDPPYLSHFMRHMVKYGEISSDCIVIGLVYIERFLAKKQFLLTPFNVRPVLMCALLVASKVWDDRGVWNIDCAEMFPDLGSLKTINAWERLFLETLDYDLTVSAGLYTRYYFLLLMNAPRVPILPETQPPKRTVMQALQQSKDKAAKNMIRGTMSFDTMQLNKSQDTKQQQPPSLLPAERFVVEARKPLKLRVIS